MNDKRFLISKTIVDVDKSFIQANIKRLKENATNVYIVPPKHAYRLDLISFQLYGTVHMKAYLIYVNDIIDVSVVVHGYKLFYPSMQDILSVINETSEFI